MFGLLHQIVDFFSLILSLGTFLILGAVVGGIGWICGRLFMGTVMSLFVAAGIGAGVVAWGVTGHWLDGKTKYRVAVLEAQNKQKAAKIKELQLTGDALRNTLGELGKAAEYNEKVIQDLNAKVKDKPKCIVPKEITDELKRIK